LKTRLKEQKAKTEIDQLKPKTFLTLRPNAFISRFNRIGEAGANELN
jgi:hypothetical protein